MRAYHNKMQGPITLCPVFDPVSQKYRGVKPMTPQEKITAPVIIDENRSRKISNGLVLDGNDPIDVLDWEWIKYNKEIASNQKEAANSPAALYYIETPDEDLKERVKLRETKYEASKIVQESSKIDREEIAQLLGIEPSAYRPIELMDLLMERAESKPDQILKAYNDPRKKEKILLFEFVNRRIIRKDNEGFYRYGETVLGNTVRGAVDWLVDEKNRVVVAHMYSQLGRGEYEGKKDLVSELEKNAKLTPAGSAENTGNLGGEPETV